MFLRLRRFARRIRWRNLEPAAGKFKYGAVLRAADKETLLEPGAEKCVGTKK